MPRNAKSSSSGHSGHRSGSRSKRGHGDEGVPLSQPKKKDYHAVDVESHDHHEHDEIGEGGSCCGFPFFHFFWLLVIVAGIVCLAVGVHNAIDAVDHEAYKWGLAVLIVPVILASIQFFLAFFETGHCASQSAHSGCCSCTLCLLDWICLFSNYLMLVIMGVAIMMLTVAAVVAYMIDAVCFGSTAGQTALCPVLYMMKDKAASSSVSWSSDMEDQLCSCKTPVSNSTGFNCDSGWALESKFTDLCQKSDLTSGATLALVGILLLNAGMIGMLAMATRTRTRMDIKRQLEK